MRFAKFLLLLMAVGGLALLQASPASAAFVLSLDATIGNAAVDVVVADNAPTDRDPTIGVIDYSGAVGAFNIQVTIGTSKPAIPVWEIDLFNLSIGGAGVLDIAISDTDFPVPPPSLNTLRSEIGGTTAGNVWAQCFLDRSNVLFGDSPPWNPDGSGNSDILVASGPVATTGLQGPYGPGAFSQELQSPAGPISAPFSMTEIIRVAHLGQGDITSVDFKNNLVPEPATCLIWGLLLPLGLYWFRRRAA